MQSKVRRRPVCLLCGTRLRLHTRAVEIREGETLEVAVSRAGLLPEHVTKVHRTWEGQPYLISCWTGRFGPEADNLFCSKSHGHRYAVDVVVPAVRWEN